MNKLFSRIIIGIIAFVFIGGCIQAVPAHAQTADPSAAQGIQISPALVELNAERGKTYTINLKVVNVTTAELIYTTAINDFNATSETGAPNVLLDSRLPASASVIDWVSTTSEFMLDSRESRAITAQVTIPADAEPGGHYGVIRFSGHAPELTETGVGLSASTGMLLLIRVSGDITESASLASFFSANSDGKQSSFFEYGPVSFVTRIENNGNIHVKPVGSIELRDMFGNLVSTIPVNESKASVLPDSIRRFESVYNEKNMFGLYTANLTIGYGTTGQAITNTITFWVLPYKILLICLLVIITLVFIASRLVKVYNKRIITKAIQKHEQKKTPRKKK